MVGGSFTSYNGVTVNYVVRLNADGSRDTSFNIGTGFNSGVSTIALQSDGKIMVGGFFTSYNGETVNRIVRLNANGSRDTSFNIGTGFNNNVNTLAIQSDSKILVGGNFTTYNGDTVNYIVRLNGDGSRDASFNIGTGFSSTFNTLALQSDGKIVAGGFFTSYNGVAVNRIIRLNADGSRDTSFNMGTGFNGSVRSISLQSDGKILVGGNFTSYNGDTVNKIVRLNSDGSRDTSFNIGTGFNGDVETLVLQADGKILVGGWFTSYQGVGANRVIRINSDGSRDTSFDMVSGFEWIVFNLALQSDGKILVGGMFTTYQESGANRIVRLNSDGSRDTSFNIGTGFSSLDVQVYSIVLQSDGKILVGGVFWSYQGVAASRIIRLNSDGSRDTSFDMGSGFAPTGSSDGVYRITLQSDGKIIVGGSFTSYNGVAVNRIIRLNADGSRDTSFNMGTGFNGTVRSISLQSDGKILVGGFFTSYNGVDVNRIIRLNADGSIDTNFNIGTGFSSGIMALALQSDGKIIVGGNFTNYQGQPAGYLIRVGN